MGDVEQLKNKFGRGAIASPPDERDKNFRVSDNIRFAAISNQVSYRLDYAILTAPIGPVLDQDGTPECVPYMASGSKRYQEYKQLRWWPNYDEERAYNLAQKYDGIPLPHDGTTIRAMLYVMQKFGMHDLISGHTWLIGPYYNLLQENDPINAAAIAIKAFNRPVPIAFDWYDSFFEDMNAEGQWTSGYIPDNRGTQDGGHAVWVWRIQTATSTYTIKSGTGSTTVKAGERLLTTRWAWGKTACNGFGNAIIPEHLFDNTVHDFWAFDDR